MVSITQVQRILDFWFGEGWQRNANLKSRPEWFRKDPNFDQAVRERFLTAHEQAIAGQYADWLEEPLSCLAFVILLDQFSRNMFREMPAAFAGDPWALSAALHALELQWDEEFQPVVRQFFYFPLEHAEDEDYQQWSVDSFQYLCELDPDEFSSVYEYACRHQKIIKKFGRFPHRNAILGRKSTNQELKFLQKPGSGF
ncbi:MAG: DUF924 family protein [Synechococcales bacterium]|nr:DUF924 family protein [Synechococcales bacterium]